MTAPQLVPDGRPGPRPVTTLAAWEAAWSQLATGGKPRAELVTAMVAASEVAPHTATAILRDAVARGLLVVLERDALGRPTLARAEL